MLETGYWGLFLLALAAATILPLSSEALLTGMLASGEFQTAWLLVAATTGNVLGSCINWALGRYLLRWRDSRWFPVKPSQLEKATLWFQRYGLWSLLLAWVPIVGDPLTLAAGVLRVNFWIFLILITVSKMGRYLALAGAFEILFS